MAGRKGDPSEVSPSVIDLLLVNIYKCSYIFFFIKVSLSDVCYYFDETRWICIVRIMKDIVLIIFSLY